LAIGWFTVSKVGAAPVQAAPRSIPCDCAVDERRLEVRQEDDLQPLKRLGSIVTGETGDDHTSLGSQVDVDAQQAGRAGHAPRRDDLADAKVETLEVVQRDHGSPTRNGDYP
jgi:hypothetical protein